MINKLYYIIIYIPSLLYTDILTICDSAKFERQYFVLRVPITCPVYFVTRLSGQISFNSKVTMLPARQEIVLRRQNQSKQRTPRYIIIPYKQYT
jgi:hypothetical protein